MGTVIDDYLQNIDPENREKLERIRRIAKEVVPDAIEVIAYKMPTLNYKGKPFLGFYLHKNHIGSYPYGGEEIEVFKDQLTEYSCSKGTIRIPLNKQIPEDLLKRIIFHRIRRIKI